MSEQPEVRVERGPVTQNEAFAIGMAKLLEREGKTIAAAELRRLHDEVESLRQAYNIVTDDCRNLTEKVIPNIRAQRDALLDALKEINSWLVCACIATPEDMAQSFPHMEQVAYAVIKMMEEGK